MYHNFWGWGICFLAHVVRLSWAIVFISDCYLRHPSVSPVTSSAVDIYHLLKVECEYSRSAAPAAAAAGRQAERVAGARGVAAHRQPQDQQQQRQQGT